ncbi:hypothetical protein J4E93_008693 [Alternaria ventricosa]|uniref:uncharacterized protein n=1 Tax=Alternaria ventricosa TaxID=1187951 RepID=UPI0020C3816A|nr:uncharacterized protein J4E93_008693 [Alternaria ventricosa]KAI4640487.1 hypothetical protein J4E93_008693 [Alternaria ventricosa]
MSSPAKPPPIKKRNGNVADTPSSRSGGKRKRDAYDPEEYQNAVYAGAGAVAVSGDNGYELDEKELDEEEAAAHQLQDEAGVEVDVYIEDEDDDGDDDDARLYATPKSVRKLSRDLYTALETHSPGRPETHVSAGKTLVGTSTHVAISPSPSSSICTGSETENDENEAIDEIDWSSSGDDLQLSFSPTTSSAGPDMTSTGEIEVEVDRLKHIPVGKQPRPRNGPGRLMTTTTRPTPTRPSPSSPSAKPIITPTITPPPPTQPRPQPSQRTMTPPITTTHPPGFEYPPSWPGKTPEERWSTNPNLRARELLSSPHRIRAELPSEPLYAFRDAEIRDGLWGLMSAVEEFAEKYFSKGAHARHTTMTADGDRFVHKDFFESLTPETAKLINCVASAGPSGLRGWHDLFVNKDKMQALVCGMIGNVLSEQVLQHVFFGGTEEGVRAVAAVQREMKDSDGESTISSIWAGNENENQRDGD